jgi:hypothetical protein
MEGASVVDPTTNTALWKLKRARKARLREYTHGQIGFLEF